MKMENFHCKPDSEQRPAQTLDTAVDSEGESVKLPTSIKEAQLMILIGEAYLKQNDQGEARPRS